MTKSLREIGESVKSVDAVVYVLDSRAPFSCINPAFAPVIAGKPVEEIREEEIRAWEEMPIEEHMEHYLSQGMDKKEAMKAVAKDRGISKRDVYQQLL